MRMDVIWAWGSIDLSLSGHTHAGQIWPTGQLGELIGVNELNYGYRQDGDYQVIVSKKRKKTRNLHVMGCMQSTGDGISKCKIQRI